MYDGELSKFTLTIGGSFLKEKIMLWFILSLIAAVCTSLTTIFSKIGIKNVNANYTTFFRTFVVVVCAFAMTLITGSISEMGELSSANWIFLILSGLSTGLSWLCYYKALKLGSVNKVAPIDKSSFVLTSILFLIFFFDETTNNRDVLTIVMLLTSIVLILIGTILMIAPSDKKVVEKRKWLIYAILSAVFASFVSFFIKLGLKGINTFNGTLIRTIIVLVFAFIIMISRGDYIKIKNVSKTSLIFLVLSALATGVSWFCEYYALSMEGVNPIAVNSIGKASILFTMFLSFVICKERFSKKAIIGLIVLSIGLALVVIFSL